MIVLPAIDLHHGKCVRLMQGDFSKQTVYGNDPAQIAHTYRTMGFAEVHIVDLDGARRGEQRHQAVVCEIIDTAGLVVQLGGGIRHYESLEHWLDAGVTRCVIGSLAVTKPDTIAAWIAEFGADRIVLALDVRLDDRRTPVLSTDGWTKSADLTLWECIDRYAGCGLKHVLCTDVGRDGALRGPNLQLYREFRERYPDIGLQASGGVRHIEDLAALRAIGCAAAITGRALLDERISPLEVSSFLRGA